MTDIPISPEPLITAAMIRAARGLLDLSQTALGESLTPNVSRRTISKIETETEGRPDSRRRDVLQAIRQFLESERIEFLFGNDEIEEGVLRRRQRT